MAGDMALGTVTADHGGAGWATVSALVTADGTAAHAMPQRLFPMRAPARMVADAVHLIAMLHGRHPGIIDYALERANGDGARAWLEAAAGAFASERSYLTRLVAAAGPIPSTPGQAESEAAVAGQRHALDMLAQSDRAGCALGAAVALALDWTAMRRMLDAAANRFGVATPACFLPDPATTAMMVAAEITTPGAERALAFGAQQVIAQHRGLWDLIDARASARGDG